MSLHNCSHYLGLCVYKIESGEFCDNLQEHWLIFMFTHFFPLTQPHSILRYLKKCSINCIIIIIFYANKVKFNKFNLFASDLSSDHWWPKQKFPTLHSMQKGMISRKQDWWSVHISFHNLFAGRVKQHSCLPTQRSNYWYPLLNMEEFLKTHELLLSIKCLQGNL